MILKTDCRHFPGDRPCQFNKTSGQMCKDCGHYQIASPHILIIKFDAVGDVLRTTSLLHAIKEKYPNSHVTWFTKQNSKPIFNNNTLVDEVMCVEQPESTAKLYVRIFDVMIHPDASPQSGAFASIIQAKEKRGFYLDESGKIQPFNNNAVEWLELGAFDQKKKANTKTYQQILHEISGFPYKKGEICLSLNEKEKLFAEDFRGNHNLQRFQRILGLNTGAGSRWQFKQWGLHQYEELIKTVQKNSPETGILLYGGPDETERNNHLVNLFPTVINTGTNNSLREFFALVNLSDIFFTGDTLGLHVATALQKKILCLFGPTSYNEIEDYGRIKKVIPEIECLVCYKMRCDFSPTCMDLISPTLVYDHLKKLF